MCNCQPFLVPVCTAGELTSRNCFLNLLLVETPWVNKLTVKLRLCSFHSMAGLRKDSDSPVNSEMSQEMKSMSDNISALAKDRKDSRSAEDGIQAQTLTLLQKFLDSQTRGADVDESAPGPSQRAVTSKRPVEMIRIGRVICPRRSQECV